MTFNPSIANITQQYRNLKGKPYITVSAKGISNGLSTIPNDGADFGPDTTLGATSPDQVGSPYTQTSGIQESINYTVNNFITEIKLMDGLFELTSPSLISIPTYDPDGKPTALYIHGTAVRTQYADITQTPAIKGGTIIHIPTEYASLSTQNALFSYNTTPSHAGPSIVFEDINFLYDSNNFTNKFVILNLSLCGGAILNRLSFTYNGTYTNIPKPQNILAIWMPLPNYFFYSSVVSNILIIGVMVSIEVESDLFRLDNVGIYKTIVGISIAAGPLAGIGAYSPYHTRVLTHLFVQDSNYSIQFYDTHPVWTVIEGLDVQYATGTNWYNGIPYITENTPGQTPGVISYSVIQADVGVVYPQIFDYPSGYNFKVITNRQSSLSISANPLVSGTVYQNTNQCDMLLKIPITYNPTSTEAATLATGVSSSTVTTTTKKSVPAGLTGADGQIDIYEMVVPAGWYYEIAVTNATIGTAEVEHTL